MSIMVSIYILYNLYDWSYSFCDHLRFFPYRFGFWYRTPSVCFSICFVCRTILFTTEADSLKIFLKGGLSFGWKTFKCQKISNKKLSSLNITFGHRLIIDSTSAAKIPPIEVAKSQMPRCPPARWTLPRWVTPIHLNPLRNSSRLRLVFSRLRLIWKCHGIGIHRYPSVSLMVFHQNACSLRADKLFQVLTWVVFLSFMSWFSAFLRSLLHVSFSFSNATSISCSCVARLATASTSGKTSRLHLAAFRSRWPVIIRMVTSFAFSESFQFESPKSFRNLWFEMSKDPMDPTWPRVMWGIPSTARSKSTDKAVQWRARKSGFWRASNTGVKSWMHSNLNTKGKGWKRNQNRR